MEAAELLGAHTTTSPRAWEHLSQLKELKSHLVCRGPWVARRRRKPSRVQRVGWGHAGPRQKPVLL